MPEPRSREAVVLIHAGAAPASSVVVEQADACRAALIDALNAARRALEEGGDAVAGVRAAVEVLESFELFNAGRGAVLCADGSVELSAAVMRGDQAAGAVAGARRTKHPIAGALVVLESPHVLMIGEDADALAAAAGIEQVGPEYFITDRQRERLRTHREAAGHATVGAVCLDGTGRLAAGTSTGGVRGQPPGRVGDCPLVGAGTWADGRVAVSCTGDGEAFIRAGASRYIAALVEQGMPVVEASERALRDVAALGGEGGLIAVDASGNTTLPYVSAFMPRGLWRAGGEPVAWVRERA